MTGPRVPDHLEDYRAEVLRWNGRINLVSRRDPARRLDALIAQSRDALDALIAAEPSLGEVDPPLLYLDLGSGGGLPGVVWHGELLDRGCRPRTWLVEPRERRSWFLERVATSGGAAPFGVLRGRWGEVAPASPGPGGRVLISLKALLLKDEEVLEGLPPFLAPDRGGEVFIVRFQPPDRIWSEALAARLGVPEPGTKGSCGTHRTIAAGAGVVPPRGKAADAASLVVSRYELLVPVSD